MKKFIRTSILVHIWNYIANFEAILPQKLLMNFEQNCIVGPKNVTNQITSNIFSFDFYSSPFGNLLGLQLGNAEKTSPMVTK